MRSCAGKTALVTSASGPIGRAVAIALGEAGAQVLVHHSRSPAVAEQIVETIRACGGKAKAVAVDLTTIQGPRELAQQARAIIGDRLDILVINTKFSRAVDLESATLEFFDSEFAANVRAPLFLVQHLLPVMNRGSCLVFSLAPLATHTDDPTSSAIHGGLGGLVSRLAVFLRSRGIRVDAIMPTSAMDAEGFEAISALRQEVRRNSALLKGAERPADIARAVTALVTSPG